MQPRSNTERSSIPEPRKRRIIVAAIDINRKDERFDDYEELPAKLKLQRVMEAINVIYTEIRSRELDTPIVIAWREYGITEGKNKRSVSNDFKREFIKALDDICKRYKNLTIVAGTISTYKHVTPERLRKVRKYYEQHRDLILLEKSQATVSSLEKNLQFTVHEKQMDEVLTSLHHLSQQDADCIIIRNSSYIFSSNHSEVLRHSKIFPSDELKFNEHLPLEHAVFQPAKTKGANTLFLVNPGGQEKEFSIAVEICREHDLGLTKRESSTLGGAKTHLHLLLSDSVPIQLDHLIGDYTIQLDSRYEPKLVVCPDEKQIACETVLYTYNLLSDNPEGELISDSGLVGPAQPLYVFEQQVLKSLDELIKQVDTEEKLELLRNIRAQFIEHSDGIVATPMQEFLISALNNEKIVAKLMSKPKAKGFANLFKTSNENVAIDRWFVKTKALLNKELLRDDNIFKDYLARTSSKK